MQTPLSTLQPALATALASVLQSLTGAPWQVEAAEPSPEEAPGPRALLSCAAPAGWEGPLGLSLALPQATALADQLLGGDGAPAESLAPDAQEALRECFLQVLEQLGQALDAGHGPQAFGSLDLRVLTPGEAQGPDFPAQSASLALKRGAFAAMLHLQLPPEPTPSAAAWPEAPAASGASARNLDLLLDVQLPVVVRMGQTEMPMGDLLRLTPGSILELNRSAEAPVDLLVNGRLLARGEVVVVDGSFAFRITEIETRAARLRSLA